MATGKIHIPQAELSSFCLKHRIRRLAFFGSVLRDDFGPESDVDMLVEFDQKAKVGLIKLSGIEIELGELIGRKVDLNTPGFISKYFRNQVLSEAEDLYVAA
jgi:predicted nucleotidyltransferase